ncbi:DUF4440 domain-containing protein [Nocardia huaxiensis]|uniref:DUF4440 domain-containing protein n=1 Tax=Nocardia huaxiensis TaxID=2755382 RepID=A0A7D6ZGB5_9NOCA|nr:DUF4440 domain-containing protein [Nocardia huaxiensis]QLY29220.1 DUF4440 domain-containing protein [Nocardia huaxiensis]UFT00440.1 DUF4440 domain-containing protein [Nocardia huaxiensis]
MAWDEVVGGMDVVGAVRDLHEDLAAWLGSAAGEEVWERFAGAQHSEFTMVGVEGTVVSREALLLALREARNAVPGLRIEVDEVDVLNRVGGTVVVRFREVHRSAAGVHGRRVTAVLVGEGGGYLWHSVHETAIEMGG